MTQNIIQKEKKMLRKPFRQGDILLWPVEKKNIPKKGRKTSYYDKYTLALGEATGHHHTLVVDDVSQEYGFTESLSKQNNRIKETISKKSKIELIEVAGKRYLSIPDRAILTHQEHKHHTAKKGTDLSEPLVFAPGCYTIIQEVTSDIIDHEALRKVID